MAKPFRVTFIHPCVGRHLGMTAYIRTWLMEPLPVATLAALLPGDVSARFYDDRLESIPFDQPTDLVCISVETYTAKRAYQIASSYRVRGVPVVMGGYHATLCPDEVRQYCETLVLGEAESVFAELVDDYRHSTAKPLYRAMGSTPHIIPDRAIYRDKKYLPLHLIEFARGCRFRCDFCAVMSFHQSQHQHRPIDQVVAEIRAISPKRLIFFIDDNMTCNLEAAKEFMRAIRPLGIRWVSQTAIHVAHDHEALQLMRESGCQGVLVGLESLNPATLKTMHKGFNLMQGGAATALENLRKAGLRVYGTFVFGYDGDSRSSIEETVCFARQQGLFIAAFNHITPFPGTPLYRRMVEERRLLYDAWWLDDRYRYNDIPFEPAQMSREELAHLCVEARTNFYSWPSILQRCKHRVQWQNPRMLFNYFMINWMHQRDISGRNGLPMGDMNWQGTILKSDMAKELVHVAG
ncbi:MAG: B12-binding domain-containing radical SAM protein [Acidobacteria bacterium]|nr:B12-binding domain-containing radical SAM protein [Acidobacteriota bacterium]